MPEHLKGKIIETAQDNINCKTTFVKLNNQLFPCTIVVVVVLLFYVHGKHLRSCRDGCTINSQYLRAEVQLKLVVSQVKLFAQEN